MLCRASRRFIKRFSFGTLAHGSEQGHLEKSPRKSVRKPLVTGINELKRVARRQRKTRQEVREIPLRPPENGLLIKSLVHVAHAVHSARSKLLSCVSEIVGIIPVHVCRLCGEVHVGEFPHRIRSCEVAGSLPTREHSWGKGGVQHVLPLVESFHLYDRLGRAVSHEERLLVDRIPAIVELCVQAGVDVPEYPTKRRSIPIYNIAGKMIDFEKKFPRNYSSGKDVEPFGFWKRNKKQWDNNLQPFPIDADPKDIAVEGMEAWETMRSGAVKLMQKYSVRTCGYCPEVQVGPKGHRARICQTYKHQMRAGQHAWQEATIDDLVPPVYVWHIPDPRSSHPLVNELRKYYGKLPAVVELFSQAGATVSESYAGVMREDVTVPDLNEERWVV
ncbi:hypothetical protein J5N97_023657 [Dioscorea zingiberensis]|uniref:APO domain-containing protein n=1 Tax=Dioscorea zingiberensis TaxID=325984 RepID=A0A9D5C595_9LILI|nr:hypothetical protein J5N97_023657 [Dioscorea zingiberensis]